MLVLQVTLLLRSHQHIRQRKYDFPEDLHLCVVPHLAQIGHVLLGPGLGYDIELLPLYEFEHVVAVNKGEGIGMSQNGKALADGGGVGNGLLELLVEL